MRRTGRSTWAGSRARTLRALAVVAALLLSGCTADWPMFRGGPERLGSSSDSTISETAVSHGSLAERWHASYRSASPSTSNAEPAVVAGVVYVQSGDGKLHAFDATSGAPRWTVDAGGALAADRKSGSSPAVVGGVVYIGGHDRQPLRVRCGDRRAVVDRAHGRHDRVVARGGERRRLHHGRRLQALRLRRGRHRELRGHACDQDVCAAVDDRPDRPAADPTQADAFAGSSPTVAHGRVYVAGVTIAPFEAVIDVFDAAGCGAPTCQPVRVLQTSTTRSVTSGHRSLRAARSWRPVRRNSYWGTLSIWAWDEASGARRWIGSPRHRTATPTCRPPQWRTDSSTGPTAFVGLQAFDIGACATSRLHDGLPAGVDRAQLL